MKRIFLSLIFVIGLSFLITSCSESVNSENNATNEAESGSAWQRTLGGSHADGAMSVQQTKDGGYVFAGFTNSDDGDVSGNHGDNDAWVVKFSTK